MPDSNDLRAQLFAVFTPEFAEHADAVRSVIGATRQVGGGGREMTPDERAEVFRRIHSLKGAARAVDLTGIEEVAHGMETVLSRLRAGEIALENPEVLNRLLERTLNASEALLILDGAADAASRHAAEADAQALLADLERASQKTSAPRTVSPAPPPVPEATLPPVTAAPSVSPGSDAPRAAPSGSAAETVRISVQQLDHLMTVARQLLLEVEGQRRLPGEVRRLAQAVAAESGAEGGTSVEVRRQAHALTREQQESAWRLGRLVNLFHDEVRAARTVTADEAVVGLDQMVTNLAKENGREVTLRVEGGDVAFDRQVAQALRDPLLHLLRNTVGHGVEPPAERIAAGKPPAGVVTLRFRVRGVRLDIDIDDDGRGLDLVSLRRAGVAAGILTEDEAERAPVDRIANLVFEPGLSTARTTDRLSGRGIGLSIVAHAVFRLGGDLRVLPKPDAPGTLFRLSLLLSLSTQRLLIVEAGGQRFGLPTFAVERLVRVRSDRFIRIAGREAVSLEGEQAPLPVASLDALLGLPPLEAANVGPGLVRSVAILSLRGLRWGLVVDGFGSEREAVVRPPGPFLGWARAVSGTVVLEDGTIALALLPGELAARLRSAGSGGANARTPSAQRRTPARAASRRTILVVDDSITTRTLEKSILESQGYRVLLATDGAQALATLREGLTLPGLAAELVVSDIEMPRMTGLELLAAIKEDARLASIPVILVTSREAYEDRERGLALGADAYIVKQKFDQHTLLEAIEQLLL